MSDYINYSRVEVYFKPANKLSNRLMNPYDVDILLGILNKYHGEYTTLIQYDKFRAVCLANDFDYMETKINLTTLLAVMSDQDLKEVFYIIA